MKSLIPTLSALALVFALSACGKSNEDTEIQYPTYQPPKPEPVWTPPTPVPTQFKTQPSNPAIDADGNCTDAVLSDYNQIVGLHKEAGIAQRTYREAEKLSDAAQEIIKKLRPDQEIPRSMVESVEATDKAAESFMQKVDEFLKAAEKFENRFGTFACNALDRETLSRQVMDPSRIYRAAKVLKDAIANP